MKGNQTECNIWGLSPGCFWYQVPSEGIPRGLGMWEVGGYVQLEWVCPGGGYVQGWVCLGGGYVHGVSMSGWVSPGHGTQRDTVGKRAVRILLECFLVGNNISQSPSVLQFKNYKIQVGQIHWTNSTEKSAAFSVFVLQGSNHKTVKSSVLVPCQAAAGLFRSSTNSLRNFPKKVYCVAIPFHGD